MKTLKRISIETCNIELYYHTLDVVRVSPISFVN